MNFATLRGVPRPYDPYTNSRLQYRHTSPNLLHVCAPISHYTMYIVTQDWFMCARSHDILEHVCYSIQDKHAHIYMASQHLFMITCWDVQKNMHMYKLTAYISSIKGWIQSFNLLHNSRQGFLILGRFNGHSEENTKKI